jgi:hypothetical protein
MEERREKVDAEEERLRIVFPGREVGLMMEIPHMFTPHLQFEGPKPRPPRLRLAPPSHLHRLHAALEAGNLRIKPRPRPRGRSEGRGGGGGGGLEGGREEEDPAAAVNGGESKGWRGK